MSDISIIQLNNTECSNPSYLDISSASENPNNGMSNFTINKRGSGATNKNRPQINLNLKSHLNNKTKKNEIKAEDNGKF